MSLDREEEHRRASLDFFLRFREALAAFLEIDAVRVRVLPHDPDHKGRAKRPQTEMNGLLASPLVKPEDVAAMLELTPEGWHAARLLVVMGGPFDFAVVSWSIHFKRRSPFAGPWLVEVPAVTDRLEVDLDQPEPFGAMLPVFFERALTGLDERLDRILGGKVPGEGGVAIEGFRSARAP